MWKKTENRWWFPRPKCIIDIVYYIVIFVFHISQFVIDMQVPLIGFHHKTLLSLRVHAAYKARSQSFEILFTEGYFEKELCHPISESIKCWQECEQRLVSAMARYLARSVVFTFLLLRPSLSAGNNCHNPPVPHTVNPLFEMILTRLWWCGYL